jgi:4-hydroxy 2-oxovalerate aldolase
MNQEQPVYLDCSLRDGGYYTSWNFKQNLVSEYLDAMSSSGINCVELGFRFLNTSGFKGATAYTSDDYIDSLSIPERLDIAIMINASDLIVDGAYSEKVIHKLVPRDANNSRVSIIRIACHYKEVAMILPSVSILVQKGYRVGLNLMQVSKISHEDITLLLKKLSAVPLDILYFADSLGSLSVGDVRQLVKLIRKDWQKSIGIHTHDNLGLALSNTLAAFEEGVTWLDSTVTGIGRGPGNAKTEELILEMGVRNKRILNLVPLLSFIKKYFAPMKLKYGWGTNVYYYLAGKKGIHPSYVQSMLTDERYTSADILNVLDNLVSTNADSFSMRGLEQANSFYKENVIGTWSPKTVFENKDIVLVGPGSSTEEHKDAIESFLALNEYETVTLNTSNNIKSDFVSFRIAVHPLRLLSDAVKYEELGQPVIAPHSMLPNEIKTRLKGAEVLDYGVKVEPNRFSFFENSCVIPTNLVLAYALAVFTAGNANKIILVGFDGYTPGDSRNTEIDELLNLYKQHPQSLDLISLTPTIYTGIEHSSVYAHI